MTKMKDLKEAGSLHISTPRQKYLLAVYRAAFKSSRHGKKHMRAITIMEQAV